MAAGAVHVLVVHAAPGCQTRRSSALASRALVRSSAAMSFPGVVFAAEHAAEHAVAAVHALGDGLQIAPGWC